MKTHKTSSRLVKTAKAGKRNMRISGSFQPKRPVIAKPVPTSNNGGKKQPKTEAK